MLFCDFVISKPWMRMMMSTMMMKTPTAVVLGPAGRDRTDWSQNSRPPSTSATWSSDPWSLTPTLIANWSGTPRRRWSDWMDRTLSTSSFWRAGRPRSSRRTKLNPHLEGPGVTVLWWTPREISSTLSHTMARRSSSRTNPPAKWPPDRPHLPPHPTHRGAYWPLCPRKARRRQQVNTSYVKKNKWNKRIKERALIKCS